MKFAMNGALTIGTLDGANVDLRDAVGHERFFLFGLSAYEVASWRARGYHPAEVLAGDPELDGLLDQISEGRFSGGDRDLFAPLVHDLRSADRFFVLADFRSYVEAQEDVGEAYRDEERWTADSIRTVAAMGPFSSDRSVREYAERIWRVSPVTVE